MWWLKLTWIKDEEFIRDKVPMTKYDIRVLSCIEMNIKSGTKFLDIGAGTGSISVQAAILGAQVTAIESKKEAVDLIIKNKNKFQVEIKTITGFAPDECPDEKYDAIFLGGNRGKMEEIFAYVKDHLKKDGILLCNFVTLDNAAKAKYLSKKMDFNTEIKLIQISQEDHLGILRGQNPIFMVRGVRK